MQSRPALATVLFVAAACFSNPAGSTWSIVAVDPETGEVGLAAATCGLGVHFIAEAVPGAGVVAAQAATSFKGRDQARDWMDEGLGATEILERLSRPSFYDGWFDPEFGDLQYGVATLSGGPDTGFADGNNLPPWSGGIKGDHFSVQGNTLRSENVVAAAASAFENGVQDSCVPALGERLLRALEAGRDAGGDNRCPVDWPAHSAVLLIAESQGETLRIATPREIGMIEGLYRSVVAYEPGEDAVEPIKQLRTSYEAAGGRRCR
jgi:uncharacterized Ntn-hydrolase superfamily protein